MVGHDLVTVTQITDTAEPTSLVFTLSVNPVDLGFPALSTESTLHQQYIFEDFEIHMVSSAGDMVNGDMLGWYDRDPDEVLPPGLEGLQVGYYKGGTTGAFKRAHTWRMPKYPGLPVLYCRDISSDERLVNQCAFNLQVVNPPSIYVSSADTSAIKLNCEFWCSYRCRFFVNDITQLLNTQPALALYSISGVGGSVLRDAGCLGLRDADLKTGPPIPASFAEANGTWLGMALGYCAGSNCEFFCALKGYGTDSVAAFELALGGKEDGLGTVGWRTLYDKDFSAVATTVGVSVTLDARVPALADRKDWEIGGEHKLSCEVENPGRNVGTLADLGIAPTDLERAWMFDTDGSVKTLHDLGVTVDDDVLWMIKTQGTLTTLTGDHYASASYFPTRCWATVFHYKTGSVALAFGDATTEGKAMEEWKAMSNKDRASWGGHPAEFIRAVKKKMREDERPEEDEVKETIREVVMEKAAEKAADQPREQKAERKAGPSPTGKPTTLLGATVATETDSDGDAVVLEPTKRLKEGKRPAPIATKAG